MCLLFSSVHIQEKHQNVVIVLVVKAIQLSQLCTFTQKVGFLRKYYSLYRMFVWISHFHIGLIDNKDWPISAQEITQLLSKAVLWNKHLFCTEAQKKDLSQPNSSLLSLINNS